MLIPYHYFFNLLLVTAFFCVTAAVPTPRPAERVACPHNTFCLPTVACSQENVVFDSRNKNSNFNDKNGTTSSTLYKDKQSAPYQNSFACGVLEPSVGHVCCAVSEGGFQPTPLSWLPNMPPSANLVIPWPGFQRTNPVEGKHEDPLKRNKSKADPFSNFTSETKTTRENSPGFDALVFPGERIERTGFRSTQQNLEDWECGVPLSPSLFNETYTAEERTINQGDYPWQVAVLTADMNYLCGGVLVGSRAVVTLASCLHNVSVDRLIIRVGDVDLSSNVEPLPAYDVSIARAVLHPAYDLASQRFDLAFLLLQDKVSSLQHVRAACLPPTHPNENSQPLDQEFAQQSGMPNQFELQSEPDLTHCHLASWGYEADDQGVEGSFSYVLKGGSFYVLSQETCKVILGKNDSLLEDQRCVAGYGGTAICQDGGGSAVVCRSGDRFVLEGIVARNSECSRNTPLLFIEISAHLNFIIDNLNLWSARQIEIAQSYNAENIPSSLLSINDNTYTQPVKQLYYSPSGTYTVFPNGDVATVGSGANGKLRDFTDGHNPGGRDDNLNQSDQTDPASAPLPVVPLHTPEIGYISVNNKGDQEGSGDVQLSGVSQHSFFHHGDVIVPGENEPRPAQVSGSYEKLIEMEDYQNSQTFVGLNGYNPPKTSTNLEEYHEKSEYGNRGDEMFEHGTSDFDIDQISNSQVSGVKYSPQTDVRPNNLEKNTVSVQPSNDQQGTVRGYDYYSHPETITAPPETIIDLNDPDFTNKSYSETVFDLNDLGSHEIDDSLSESSHFTSSIISSLETGQPNLQAQEIPSRRFPGSSFLLGNSDINPSFLETPGTTQSNFPKREFPKKFYGSVPGVAPMRFPYQHSDDRPQFYEWRPMEFHNPLIQHGSYTMYHPPNLNQFPHHPREPHFQTDYQRYPFRPHYGYPHPLYFNPNFGAGRPHREPVRLTFMPNFTPEPYPIIPEVYNPVIDRRPPQRLISTDHTSSITTDPAPQPPQEDRTEIISEELKSSPNENLNIVYQYLSKYQ